MKNECAYELHELIAGLKSAVAVAIQVGNAKMIRDCYARVMKNQAYKSQWAGAAQQARGGADRNQVEIEAKQNQRQNKLESQKE